MTDTTIDRSQMVKLKENTMLNAGEYYHEGNSLINDPPHWRAIPKAGHWLAAGTTVNIPPATLDPHPVDQWAQPSWAPTMFHPGHPSIASAERTAEIERKRVAAIEAENANLKAQLAKITEESKTS